MHPGLFDEPAGTAKPVWESPSIAEIEKADKAETEALKNQIGEKRRAMLEELIKSGHAVIVRPADRLGYPRIEIDGVRYVLSGQDVIEGGVLSLDIPEEDRFNSPPPIPKQQEQGEIPLDIF
jgi:hypothetical protein